MPKTELNIGPACSRFLSSILDLSDFIEPSSSILEKNERYIYILESIVLKMKEISQYQSKVAACANLEESKPDSFKNFVPLVCARKKIKEDLIRDKLQLTQKLVCGLISAFKVIIQMYKESGNCNATVLIYKFTKHALRAIATFPNPNSAKYSSVNALSNEVIAVKNLALVYIIGPVHRAQIIFQNFLPVIFECLEKNALVKLFTNFLLGHRKTSKFLSTTLLHHFSCITFLETLSNDTISTKKARLILSLFADVLRSFIIFPNTIKSFHLKLVSAILRNSIALIPQSSHPRNLFWILKNLYTVLLHKKGAKLKTCSDTLLSLLPCLFRAFDVWLQRPLECKIWCIILETTLSIFEAIINKSVLHVLPYINIICKCLIFSLKEDSVICLMALDVFDRILKNVTLDYISLCILPIKDELLYALYSAMKRPEGKINDKTLEILGKMGCLNRTSFKDAHKLQATENSSFCLSITFENISDSITVPITKYPIDLAFKSIINPHEDVSRKELWWSFVKELLKLYMKSIEKSFSILHADKSLQFCTVHKRALIVMFAATYVEHLSNDAKTFKEDLVKAYITHSSIQQVGEKNNLFLLLLDAAFEVISMVLPDYKETVDITILTDVISMTETLGYEKIYSFPCFEHVVNNVAELCRKESWNEKIAGCKTISYILEMTDYQWKSIHIYKFLKPLLFCLSNSNGKLSFDVPNQAVYLLQEMLMSVAKYAKSCNPEVQNSFLDSITEILIRELVSPDFCVRKQVRILLCRLSHIYEKELKDLLAFPAPLLIDSLHIVRLYENFEFGSSLKLNLFQHVIKEEYKKLYQELKSFFIRYSTFESDFLATSDPVYLNVTNQWCGALNALCFNFIHGVSIKKLFPIYIKALLFPVNKVSETAVKCLKYVVNNYHKLRFTVAELVADWASHLFAHLQAKQLLEKYKLQELLYFRQIFPLWPERHFYFPTFTAFKYLQTSLMDKLKNGLSEVDACLEKLSIVIQIMNTLTNLNSKMIAEVWFFVTDLEPYSKFILSSCLKDPLLEFCSLHHLEISSEFKCDRGWKSFLFKELIKFQDVSELERIYNESLFLVLNLSQALQMLVYIAKCSPRWFNKKYRLAKYLHTSFNKSFDKKFPTKSSSSLETFIFIKECKSLVKCLTCCFINMPDNLEILFDLMKVFKSPLASNFQTLKDYIINTVAKEFSTSWKEKCFIRFQSIFTVDKPHPAVAEILEYIIIPSFYHAFKEENSEHFFKSSDEEGLSVVDVFFSCTFNIERHSERVQNIFIKFVILFAEHLKLISYKNVFVEESRNFAKALLKNRQCVSYSSLLLLMLQLEDVSSYISEKTEEFVKTCLVTIMKSAEEEFVFEKALYLCATKLPTRIFEKCCELIVTDYDTSLKRTLYMISVCREEFHDVAYIFLRFFKKLSESSSLGNEDTKNIVTLIEVMCPQTKQDKRKVTEKEIKWIVNLLLQNVDTPGLSNKCSSLFIRIMKGNVFPICGLTFGNWLSSRLKAIAVQPEKYKNKCNIFMLMTESLDHMPAPIVISFVNHLYGCFEFYINPSENEAGVSPSRLIVLHYITRFLSKLIGKYPFNPAKLPEELKKFYMYMYIKRIDIKNPVYKSIVLEAVGKSFYSYEFKKSILTIVNTVFETYLKKPEISAIVIVWLKILEKILDELNGEDKRNLLSLFFLQIENISHGGIILEIIISMDLFIEFLTKEIKEFLQSQKKDRRLRYFYSQVLYETFLVLGMLSSKVDLNFACDEKINNYLFKTLMTFRKYYNYLLLEDNSLRPEHPRSYGESKESSVKIEDVFRESQFKKLLLYKSTAYHYPKNQKKIFQQLIEKVSPDIYEVVSYIYSDKFSTRIPKFYLASCINLLSMAAKKFYGNPDVKNADNFFESPDIFSLLVQICYEDIFLAEYIWMHLFPNIWKSLGEEKQKAILQSDKTKVCLDVVSSQKYSMVPNPFDVFINAAVRCDPEFCFYVFEKFIQRSFDFQVLGSMVLEKYFFSLKNSSENYSKCIDTLNEIYTHMEESDMYFCFNQYYANHRPKTLYAMSKLQDNYICESHHLYKELVTNYINEDLTKYKSAEVRFCANEFIKCSKELNKWDVLSHIGDFSSLKNVELFSKWNIQDRSETLTLQSSLSNSSPKACDFDKMIDSVLHKCKRTWKSLSKFFNRQHYSLLQLTQEIIEIKEAYSLQKNFPDSEPSVTSQRMKDIYRKWQEHQSYLPSDDFLFLTELFHVRLAFLKYFNSKCSDKLKKICQKDNSKLVNEYISQFTIHEMNESLIELSTVALKFRNLPPKKVMLNKFFYKNVFNFLQLKLLSVMQHVKGLSSNLSTKDMKCIEKRLQHISKNSIAYLQPGDQEELNVYMLRIYKELDFDITESANRLITLRPKNARLYEILSEIVEEKSRILTLECLLLSCRFGDTLNSVKLVPKILHILDTGDTDSDLPEILEKFKIPVHYWLPFLPFLVSCLLHSLNRDNTSRMEIDGETKPSLSLVLTNILLEIGKTFPQEVFFSVCSFKENCSELIVGDQGICSKFIASGQKKCLEIIASLKGIYPSLINRLEGIVKDIEVFKPTAPELYLHHLKNLLEETCFFIYRNHEYGYGDEDSSWFEEFVSYIKTALKPIFDFTNSDSSSNVPSNEMTSGLDFCSIASIFDVLMRLKQILLNACDKVKKESFFLDEKCPRLSNFHVEDDDIYVFGQSSFVDNSSRVKISNFLPKVEVQKWNDHLVYKINILGKNGKIYAFLLEESLFQVENLKTVKCVQMLDNLNVVLDNYVDCARRFFNFHFPKITSICHQLILVPYHDGMLPYQDIYGQEVKCGDFLPHEFFTKLLSNSPEFFMESGEILPLFKSTCSAISKDILTNWVQKLYQTPVEFFCFKKEFLKQISLLIAAEYFLNICIKKELLIHKDSGVVTALHPRLNLSDLHYFSILLPPNIYEFIGPLGEKIISEIVYWIGSCLKENTKVIEAYLHLLKKEYFEDTEEEVYCSINLITDKLSSISRRQIQRIVESGTLKENLCFVNPTRQPFF